jgi:hypothetical protein
MASTPAPSDDELIATGEKILSGLQALEHNVSRDLRWVALLFGIPFFVLVSPLLYDSLLELADLRTLAVASGIAISMGLYGWFRWRRKKTTHMRHP